MHRTRIILIVANCLTWYESFCKVNCYVLSLQWGLIWFALDEARQFPIWLTSRLDNFCISREADFLLLTHPQGWCWRWEEWAGRLSEVIGTVTIVETQFERDLRNRHLAGSWSTLVDVCAWEQCVRARNHSVHFFLQRFCPFAGLYYLLGFRAPEYSKLTNRRGGCIVVRAENQDQASSGCFFRITFCIFHQPTYYGNR